jgi:hypothetical protein
MPTEYLMTMTTDTETPAPTETIETPAPTPDGSLLEGVTPPPAPDAPPPPGDFSWLPEKFHVVQNGVLDEAASTRKLAESYKALESHKGAVSQAPETPDGYKIEPPKDADGKPVDIDMEAFAADPLFKAFAADAHKAGMSNEQVQLVIDKYISLAPSLVAADAQLSLDEAKAELSTLWKDEASMSSNLSNVVKAINGFGAEADDVPGSRSRLMAKYGRDPDFIAFAASVAQEMKEDKLPSDPVSVAEHDIESLQKSPAYWDPKNPDHARTRAQVDAYYAKKFGTSARGRTAA